MNTISPAALPVRLGRDRLPYPGLYLETRHDARISVGDGVVMPRGVHLAAYDDIDIDAGCMTRVEARCSWPAKLGAAKALYPRLITQEPTKKDSCHV